MTWCRNIHISLETVHIIIADVILFFVILAWPVFVPIALGNGSYKKVCGFCTIYAWLFSCHVIQARVLLLLQLFYLYHLLLKAWARAYIYHLLL